MAIEEFIEGHEGFYDTLTIDGRVACDFVSHYYPNVLEAMRTRWISPQFVATNRIDEPGYDEVKVMGAQVIAGARHRHLGDPHGVVLRAQGPELLRDRLPPAGRRPVGQLLRRRTSSTSTANGRSRSATASPTGAPSRRYACGIIALRPDRDGRIAGYEGTEAIFHHYGDLVVGSHFPSPGTPTQPVAAGYMANAWMRVRHPDFDELRRILGEIGERIRVHAH